MLRAAWVHEGGTWSIPGGALRAGESPRAGAYRETIEEIGPIPDSVVTGTDTVDCGGGWLFHTVHATVERPFAAPGSPEVDAVRWVTEGELGQLALHPGFRRWMNRRP